MGQMGQEWGVLDMALLWLTLGPSNGFPDTPSF